MIQQECGTEAQSYLIFHRQLLILMAYLTFVSFISSVALFTSDLINSKFYELPF